LIEICVSAVKRTPIFFSAHFGNTLNNRQNLFLAFGAQKRHANPLGVPHHSLFFFGSLVVKGMLTLSVITGKRG
jgi:hypothetical protein